MIQNQWRLKSSQYTLIIPHRVIQLSAISFWIPETRLHLPQVTEQIGQFPPKRLKYRHRHPFFFFFLPHPQENSFALNQSEARFTELGEYSQEFSQVDMSSQIETVVKNCFVRLFVCVAVYMSVPLCYLLCMHKLYMYSCICLLSIVGTGVLNRCTVLCAITVLYLLE